MTDPHHDPARIPAAAAAPGWYPVAPGSPTVRWWDGAQWTEHLQNQPYAPSAVVSRVTAATPVYNVFIWLFTLLPVIPVLALLPLDLGSMMEESMRRAVLTPRAGGFATSTLVLSPGYVLVQLVSFLVYAAMVVCAYLDWRRLGRLGFARRFHWAWGFLTLVYLIGRAVMVRKESGRGLAVIWVYAGVVVVSFIVTGVQIAGVFSAMSGLMSSYR